MDDGILKYRQDTYSEYLDYQQSRYADTPKESDKKSARLAIVGLRQMRLERRPRILEIGCSAACFLMHLRTILPDAELVGGDIMPESISACRANPRLAGIRFEVMDVFELQPAYDVIVANAVNVYFDQAEYERALRGIGNALVPGGWYVAYEWAFLGERQQLVEEKTPSHPYGIKFWYRSEANIRKALLGAGFNEIEVIPFDIPIDIPPIANPRPGSDDELVTHTRMDPVTGRRLMYRGELYQPWCHIVARKAAT